jgi:hypothetical protein
MLYDMRMAIDDTQETDPSSTGEMSPDGTWRPWRYEVEDEDFVIRVTEEARYLDMWQENETTWAELERDFPQRAYALAIASRVSRIVDRFKSLNLVEKMLDFDGSLKSNSVEITPYEWLKIILDALLSRVTSIRDCVFLVVADVYDLGLEPRDVTLQSLRRLVPDEKVLDVLTRFSKAAPDLRDERDRHLHRGEERRLSDMDFFFKLFSRSSPTLATNRVSLWDREQGAYEIEIDPSRMYIEAIDEIRSRFYEDCDHLLALTKEFFHLIEGEFERRWEAKRDIAREMGMKLYPWEAE